MSPTEIKSLCHSLDLWPSKQLGQNFLSDPRVSAEIVAALHPEEADLVIEIGPGLGALTEHLVGKCPRVVLIEMDKRLAERMHHLYAGDPTVTVIQGDAAQIDLRPYFAAGRVKALGNLPYSAGGAILGHFLRHPTPVTDAVFMLQKEVCARLRAQPSTKDYGILTLRIQHRWHVQHIRTVPPEVFEPRPHVDSAVARFLPRAPDEFPPFDKELFDRLIRLGFHQRRKQLKKSLPPELPMPWEEIAEKIGVPAEARAEALTLAQWVELSRLLDSRAHAHVAQDVEEIFDVVNENNEVIGQAARREVHAQKLLHRSIVVLVFNKKGELFLQKRSHWKDHNPLRWDSSVAGHLNAGENCSDAARRELQEELGITGAVELEEFGFMTNRDNDFFEFVQIYRVEYSGALRWPPAEIDCGAFFPLAQIDLWIKTRPQDFSGFHCLWVHLRKEGKLGFAPT